MKPSAPDNGRGFITDAHEAAFHAAVAKVERDRAAYADREFLPIAERVHYLEEKLEHFHAVLDAEGRKQIVYIGPPDGSGSRLGIGNLSWIVAPKTEGCALCVTTGDDWAAIIMENETAVLPEWRDRIGIHCTYGMGIDAAYTEAVTLAIKEGCTHLLTVEDDTFPPDDALVTLLAHRKDVVCGWYPKRQAIREGAPIVIKNGIRQHLNDPADGSLVELYTAVMGCTLFDMRVFERIQMPWFVTTPQLTQDSFFSQKAREAGFTLWCDTSIRCRPVDLTDQRVE